MTTEQTSAGFSRGAIACGDIGLRDDEVAGLWRASVLWLERVLAKE